MSLRKAVGDAAALRTSGLLSLLGGTILVTDDKLLSTLIVGITLVVVVKMVATYGALFGAAVWVEKSVRVVRQAAGIV